MTRDSQPTLKLKPIWTNGSYIYEVTYPNGSETERAEIDRLADEAGYARTGEIWIPPGEGKAMLDFHRNVRSAGFCLEFDDDLDRRPFNLHRLRLEPKTRHQLETLPDFELYNLGGWTPVQGEGELDGCYWYFRARGSYWRFELGGNEMRTRSPRWWCEEPWPTKTGFEAGYLSNQEAIVCILRAVGKFRFGDHGHFRPDHPQYQRTILDGWSLGAISLRIATTRLGLTGDEVIKLTEEYGIDLPWTASRELEHLKANATPLRRLSPRKV